MPSLTKIRKSPKLGHVAFSVDGAAVACISAKTLCVDEGKTGDPVIRGERYALALEVSHFRDGTRVAVDTAGAVLVVDTRTAGSAR